MSEPPTTQPLPHQLHECNEAFLNQGNNRGLLSHETHPISLMPAKTCSSNKKRSSRSQNIALFHFILTRFVSPRIGCPGFARLYLWRTHKAMKGKIRVEIPSHGRAGGADAKGVCPSRSCTRRIEADNRAIGGAHKAVRHKIRVEILPGRGFARITTPRNRTLKRSRSGLRNVKRGDRAIGSAQETVIHPVPVNVVS